MTLIEEFGMVRKETSVVELPDGRAVMKVRTVYGGSQIFQYVELYRGGERIGGGELGYWSPPEDAAYVEVSDRELAAEVLAHLP